MRLLLYMILKVLLYYSTPNLRIIPLSIYIYIMCKRTNELRNRLHVNA